MHFFASRAFKRYMNSDGNNKNVPYSCRQQIKLTELIQASCMEGVKFFL